MIIFIENGFFFSTTWDKTLFLLFPEVVYIVFVLSLVRTEIFGLGIPFVISMVLDNQDKNGPCY